MGSRSSRSRPEYDDPYISRQAYPDPHVGVNDSAYEYVGTDEMPDPDEPRSSRRHSPSRRHKSSRSATLPPKYADHPSPPRSKRAESPVRASRHSDSPPRHRRSRHDTSPQPRRSKGDVVVDAPGGKTKDKYGRWMERPAVKNMKSYGTKGLKTVGDIVEAYAAAQAGGAVSGGGRSEARGRERYDDYDDDPYEKPSRRSRRHYSPTPSPSPPRRRGGGRSDGRSDRRRSTANAKERSFSTSPPPRGRGYNSDEDSRRHRRSRRYSPSSSPSPSPRRRRARSHADDKVHSTKSRTNKHPHMQHYKDEMKSPNPEIAHRWQLAARAALEAGGVTAFRLRKEPGSWTGAKGAKVVTAALGAAAIDSFVDKDPRKTKPGGVKGMAESVVGGMLASKLMGVPSNSTRSGKPRKW
ncbi:hypothetical protein LQW54_002562 [Pestalotiopsis sp. IQ-011]